MSESEESQSGLSHATAGIDNEKGSWGYEYRVTGSLKYGESGFMPFTTEWDSRRDAAVEAAQNARKNGVACVEIETRRTHRTVDFEGCPE